ncbi:hypothetical protein F4778DRAFT_9309 [Xylariomycetidae sp. FL2044]|nr:hypothetical protein F4778DRAFT_9309 [Xylariomycetidae sp. FL2044]
MQYPYNIVTIALCVLLGVCILIALWLRFTVFAHRFPSPSAERRAREKCDPRTPVSFLHALTELEQVTEKRAERNPQTEPEGCECPICLGPLYATSQTPSKAAAAAADTNEVDLEAGERLSRATTVTDDTVAALKLKRHSTQAIHDDVLKMKKCTHIFHARCLATWFLRRKYDCPVCRTTYYQEVEAMEPDVDYREPQPPLPVAVFW